MVYLEFIILAIIGTASLSIFWTSLKIGITPMPSSRKVCQLLLRKVNVAEGATIVDLGSGWGTLVVSFAKKYPNHPVVGYELSLIPFLVSYFLKIVFRLKNLSLERKDFLQVDFQDNVVLICYLYPEGMQKLEAKIKKHKFIEGWLVSNTFALPEQRISQTARIQDLYLTPIYFYNLAKYT